ncbi:MAG TPA: hypothetical protein VIG66_00650 [Noviherbaspirillum sp.]
MVKLHQALAGTALLACSQLALAQAAADIVVVPPDNAPVLIAPEVEVVPATPAEPATGGAQVEPAPATPSTAAPAPDASGASSAAGTSASGTEPGGMVVGTIIQTQPATDAPTAAEMSNDPFVQRREARAQARAEYKARMQAAQREYRQDKRAADSMLEQQSGN